MYAATNSPGPCSDDEVEFLGTTNNNSSTNALLPSDVRTMKIKDIKRELETEYRISTKLMIEKDELVSALINARNKKGQSSTNDDTSVADYRASARSKYEQSILLEKSSTNHPLSNGSLQHSSPNQSNKKKEGPRKLDMVQRLNAKQLQAYNLAMNQRKSIFITGPAGVGKSVVLKHIMEALAQRRQKGTWAATSSTGTTAVALGGETLHHFAGCGVPSLVTDFRKCFGERSLARWLR